MIRGYYRSFDSIRRPYVDAVVNFPTLGISGLQVRFLVDTGADRVLLSPVAALRLVDRFQVDLGALPIASSQGVGGRVTSRIVEAVVTMDTFSVSLDIAILEPPPGDADPPSIPSLLGRRVIDQFALHLSVRKDHVLFLDVEEENALNLPC